MEKQNENFIQGFKPNLIFSRPKSRYDYKVKYLKNKNVFPNNPFTTHKILNTQQNPCKTPKQLSRVLIEASFMLTEFQPNHPNYISAKNFSCSPSKNKKKPNNRKFTPEPLNLFNNQKLSGFKNFPNRHLTKSTREYKPRMKSIKNRDNSEFPRVIKYPPVKPLYPTKNLGETSLLKRKPSVDMIIYSPTKTHN